MRQASKPTWYTDIHGELIYEGDTVKTFSGHLHEVVWSEVEQDYCLKGIKPLREVNGQVEIVAPPPPINSTPQLKQ